MHDVDPLHQVEGLTSMSDRERLGHLIRGLRMQATGYGVSRIEVRSDEMLRVLDAADKGLFLSIDVPRQVDAVRKKLRIAETDLRLIRSDRQDLRDAYKADVVKIKAAGFEDFDELIYWVTEAQKQGVRVPDRELTEVEDNARMFSAEALQAAAKRTGDRLREILLPAEAMRQGQPGADMQGEMPLRNPDRTRATVQPDRRVQSLIDEVSEMPEDLKADFDHDIEDPCEQTDVLPVVEDLPF